MFSATISRFSVSWLTEFLLPCLQTGSTPITVLNKANVESSLNVPEHLAHYENASLAKRLAGLGYSFTKNHSLSDGNKRAASIMILVYCVEKEKGLMLCKHWPKGSDFTRADIEKIFQELEVQEDLRQLTMVAANEMTQEDLTKYFTKRLAKYQN